MIEVDPETGRCWHDHREDKGPAELRESAYRRGYHQALCDAIEAIEIGHGDMATFKKWHDQVYSWRLRRGKYKRARSFVQRPPRTPADKVNFPHAWPDGSWRPDPPPKD